MEATRWTLTFVGDGSRAVLSTTEKLERETVEHVQDMWKRFVDASDPQIMIIGDCKVERVDRIELEIGADAILVRGRS